MPEAAVAIPAAAPAAPVQATPAPSPAVKARDEGVVSTFEAPEQEPAAPAESVPDVQNKESQADSAAPDGDKEKEQLTPEQAAKREGRRFERKLDKAYRERAQERARAEMLERQLAEMRQQPQQNGSDANRPTLEQHGFDADKYAQAVVEYEWNKRQASAKAEYAATQQKAYVESLSKSWEEKSARADDKYDDWNKVVGDIRPESPILVAIMEAENGEDVAYFLAKNRKEIERISALPPVAQIREIGKIEARLASQPVKPKTPSAAPEPIKPVDSGSAPSTRKLGELSQKDFEARRREYIANRR